MLGIFNLEQFIINVAFTSRRDLYRLEFSQENFKLVALLNIRTDGVSATD
jgi:hypothetical protein